MKLSDYLLLRLVPVLGAGLIRLVRATMRIETESRPDWGEVNRNPGGIIYAFWHNRLFLMPYAPRGRKVAVLISRHRDGEYISRTISFFGFPSVRGSSSRGGERALREMPRLLRQGIDVAITPDGPRGPRYHAQPGAVYIARISGRPIYPLTFAAERCHTFSSWDRFQVPKFFSRGVFVWGEPIRVARGDDLEEKRLQLQESLMEITRRADGRYGRRPEIEGQPPGVTE